MCFQDVAFLPSDPYSPPHYLSIIVEVRTSVPPHALALWLVLARACSV